MSTYNNHIRDAASWKDEIISADREVFLSLQDKISYECINDLLTDYDIPVDKKAYLLFPVISLHRSYLKSFWSQPHWILQKQHGLAYLL